MKNKIWTGFDSHLDFFEKCVPSTADTEIDRIGFFDIGTNEYTEIVCDRDSMEKITVGFVCAKNAEILTIWKDKEFGAYFVRYKKKDKNSISRFEFSNRNLFNRNDDLDLDSDYIKKALDESLKGERTNV